MPNISPIGHRTESAALIDRYVNKTSDSLEKTIRTNSSNLHANDIMGLLSPVYPGESSRGFKEFDRNLDAVGEELMALLREVHS